MAVDVEPSMNARTVLRAIAVVMLMTVSGCGGARTIDQPAPEASPAGSADGVSFDLYTHCGIKWAKIRGTFWRAEHELNDGNGNPPEGWGNPTQAGRLSFQSRRTATFRSTPGVVVFHRTPHTEPPFVCS